ncbi:hypothetical protein A0U93_03080 [Neoasaia chiangmaiensis]|uniref:Uncharacterized protein n=2 Tax=Neoasaia chiangmaiensis TaxID=320497 RepID=A0A1U9KN17_9PROT|nr:hypothetical protein A0U93_03080 [Neoasaia chiangmaiensis]
MLHPMKYIAPGITVLLAFSGVAEAAPTLPAACMASRAQYEQNVGNDLSQSGYRAQLGNTAAQIRIDQASLNDAAHRLDTSQLKHANDIAALGALLALYGKTTPACDTPQAHQAAEDIARRIREGAQPELTWHNVRLMKADRSYTARTAHIRFLPDTGARSAQIRVQLSVSGIAEASGKLAPQSFAADISVPPRALTDNDGSEGQTMTVRQGETATINNLHAVFGASNVDGHGFVQPGADWRTSTSQMHLEITNIGDLLNAVRANSSAGVTTALAMAQFMGHRDGNRLSWDVALGNGTVTVNNVPLPLPLP